MKLCGIYLITHIASGRKYVGQSVDIKRRVRLHASGKSGHWIGKAVLKYGWPAFKFEVLELCLRNELNDAEINWLTVHDCVAPKGFNLTTGGCQQWQVSEETRERIRAAKAHISDETRAKIGAASKGRKKSAEAMARMAANNTGKTHSAETRAILSKKLKGRTFTDEHRAKISSAAKERLKDPKRRALLSKNMLGKTMSEEAKAKMSQARIGKKHSEQTLSLMSAAQKKAWNTREMTQEAKDKMADGRRASNALRKAALMTAPLAEKSVPA